MPNLYATQPINRNRAPAYIPQDVPVYRVTEEKGFFIDNVLHPAGTILEFAETPNPGLEPLNALAIDTQRKYLAELDRLGQEWSKQEKKGYIPQLPQFEASLVAKNKRNRRGVTEVPLMANKIVAEQRAFVVDTTPGPTGDIQAVGSLAKNESSMPIQRGTTESVQTALSETIAQSGKPNPAGVQKSFTSEKLTLDGKLGKK